jgi:uncharacterized membrane protein
MNIGSFDRETLLDLVVNAIPLVMMAFFIVVFAVFNPFGSDPASTAIQFSIVIVTFGALFLLTYYSGRAISRAEAELEEEPEAYAEPEAAAANLNEAVVDADGETGGEPRDDEESAS